ncbi:MAG: hypothetical protein GX620_10265 [Chloroflexi bacterium]|nr:hypothetical protein [Chloroflexota bacterium]
MEEVSAVTAATVIRFSETLEDSSADFYKNLAESWAEQRDQFLAFARDCDRNATQIVRTYQETISDALDATSSFTGLKLDEYRPNTDLPGNASHVDGLKTAIDLEDKAIAFYRTVAEQASLLATIPRAFSRAAERRDKRRTKLESLLAEVET